MADKKLELVRKNLNKLLFVHYSCQSFTDDNEGYSPRITSIAVLFNDGHILKSFSIHFVAEVLHIKRDEIEKTLGMKIIQEIPYDKRVPESISNKKPVVLFKKNSKSSKAFIRLAASIVGQEYKSPLKQIVKKIKNKI